jgi:putative DNA primase/helicase
MTATQEEMLDVLRNMVKEDQQRAKANGGGEEQEPTDAEITRLAKLSLVEYDRQRKAAAENLGLRASILDRLVRAERERLNPNDGSKQGHAIAFPDPEPWSDSVAGAELLDNLAAAIRRHVVLPDRARDACALWVVHTYLTDRFLISPRLGVRSPTKGCGKTLLLDVLDRVVARPLPTANVTAAAIFRVIEAHRPTLLVDEADTFLRDNDELRGVLNSGHRKGGAVLRTVGDDHEPRSFATYAPCVIALIGALPETLHDRAVTVDLKRRLPSEKADPFRPDRADHLDVLARKAVRWAKDNADRIDVADPAMPAGIINREADNWRPLLAIAAVAGGEWPERARKAAEAAHIAAADDAESRLELLLGDIRDSFSAEGKAEMPSADLVKALIAIEGRPWGELGKNHKPLTQNGLARRLKPLGITPDTIREGKTMFKGYYLHRFQEALSRYLPPEGVSQPSHRNKCDEMGTSGPSQTVTPERDVTDAKCEKSNNDGLCYGVTVGKEENGDARASQEDSPEPGVGETRRTQLIEWCRNWIAQGEPLEELADALRMTIREEIDDPDQVEAELEKVKQLLQPQAATVASVPFMITQEMKRRLRICGYSDAQIAAMTPQQAHSALGQFVPSH